MMPFFSDRQYLRSGVWLEDKREDNSELLCAVLCTADVHSDMHTHVTSSYIFAC